MVLSCRRPLVVFAAFLFGPALSRSFLRSRILKPSCVQSISQSLDPQGKASEQKQSEEPLNPNYYCVNPKPFTLIDPMSSIEFSISDERSQGFGPSKPQRHIPQTLVAMLLRNSLPSMSSSNTNPKAAMFFCEIRCTLLGDLILRESY